MIVNDTDTVRRETIEENERSRMLFVAADTLNYTNKPLDAEAAYRAAMDATDDYGVYYHLAQGQIYALHDNLEYALTEFEIASQINDNIDSVHINLGLTYRKLAGRWNSRNAREKAQEMMAESIASLERATEVSPDNPGAWSTKSMTYLAMGNASLKDAEDCTNRALSLDPNSYSALTNLARIRQQQGSIPEARELAHQAIALAPDNPFAYSLLGGRKGKDSLEPKPIKALEWLQKALEREPDNTYVLGEIAKAYRELGDNGQAFEYFDKVAKANPENYFSLTNRGQAHHKLGNYESAEADLRLALSIKHDHLPAMSALCDVLKDLRRNEEALTLAEHPMLRNGNPKQRKVYQELLSLVEGDQSESIRMTRQLLDSKPNFRHPSTIAAAERALLLFSQNFHAHGLLGRCNLELGKLSLARNYLERAVNLNPKVHYYRKPLGQVYEALKEYEAAEREFRLLLGSNPKNEWAQQAIQRVERNIRAATRAQKKIQSGQELVFLNNKTGREERHSVSLIKEFLADRIKDWNLPIGEIIDQIGESPVFIIAKTGVGKTVTVPTKILLALCDELASTGVAPTRNGPQVFVVEPRIPICTMTMAEMNEGYQSYLAYRLTDNFEVRDYVAKRGGEFISRDPKSMANVVRLVHELVDAGKTPYDPRHFNLYGCITSVTGKINADAPIVFITTGIMESLTFEGSKLDPRLNRIVIDEAHVTIEANPAIELGISLARKQGIKIDYMSATVEPGSIATDLGVKVVYAGTQRFPIHLTNLGATVEDRILDLVKDFLLDPDPEKFPQPSHFDDPEIRARIQRVRLHLLSPNGFVDEGRHYPGLRERPQGMLVIVNSHQSENSDTFRIADLVARAPFNKPDRRVHTLRLASSVVRDPAQKLAFDRLVKNIEDQNGRYVIVATNVVEMGLTFSSLDYVITMDSEFDTDFVDGSQMIKKVALGVNALYQRIGRVGRVRPGMAFIAQDYGATYTTLDDQALAAGLREAPIRYPLAKGSFLKLALYSFRERLPEANLRERIGDLALPSRIQEDADLWKRFLAERARLKRIGIASGDDLTSVGKAALGFVGLEDMDFARLLATVIQNHGQKSDIAAVFAVIAASSEIGFNDLMERNYLLSSTQQLSAVEIIHQDSLGMSAQNAYRLVKANENNIEQLRLALLTSGIDNQISSDMITFIQAGYRVTFAGTSIDTPGDQVGSSNFFQDDNGDEDAVLEPEMSREGDDDSDLSEEILRDLAAHSADLTIGFERAVVSFSDQSELINTYRIFRHFFNNYFAKIRSRTLNSLEASELRRALANEASKLQVSDRALNAINNGFVQLMKHAGIELSKEVRTVSAVLHLTDDERRSIAEGTLRNLLYERIGTDDQFDLCLKLLEYVGVARRCDYVSAAQSLDGLGFKTDSEHVRELWFLIVREAQARIERELELFMVTESLEVLPPITKGLEREILRVLRAPGYHRELVFEKGEFGLVATVRDELGHALELRLSDDNTPLSGALAGKESVRALVKLTPTMGNSTIRSDVASGFEQIEEKRFRISHVTVVQ